MVVLVGESCSSPISFPEKHHSSSSAENVFPSLRSLHSTLPLIDALISARALQYSTPVLCEVILPRHVWLRVKCPPLRACTQPQVASTMNTLLSQFPSCCHGSTFGAAGLLSRTSLIPWYEQKLDLISAFDQITSQQSAVIRKFLCSLYPPSSGLCSRRVIHGGNFKAAPCTVHLIYFLTFLWFGGDSVQPCVSLCACTTHTTCTHMHTDKPTDWRHWIHTPPEEGLTSFHVLRMGFLEFTREHPWMGAALPQSLHASLESKLLPIRWIFYWRFPLGSQVPPRSTFLLTLW